MVQGIEVWRGRPILYDSGDFVDDYAVDPGLRNDLSALFLLRVRPPAVEQLEVLPVAIDDMQVNLAHRTERRFFLDRLVELSNEMGTVVEVAGNSARIAISTPVAAGGRR